MKSKYHLIISVISANLLIIMSAASLLVLNNVDTIITNWILKDAQLSGYP